MFPSRRTLGKIVPVLLLLFFLLQPIRPAWAYSEDHSDVLILHSYHPGLPWTDSVMAGIREILRGRAADSIHLHIEYLDTLRHISPDYATRVLDAIFRYKLGGKHFDLVLLADNPALSFALRHRKEFFADTPLVFCGINNFHPGMTADFPRVTGVAEYPSYDETIETALRLHPGTRQVIVIGGLSSVTNRENRKMIKAALAENKFPVSFVFWDDVPLEELTPRIAGLPAETLILFHGSIALRSGETLSFGEEMQAIRAASRRPVYSFWDVFLGKGIVGGKLVSGRDQGRIAARMALRILAGEDADGIPVVSESNRFVFDYLELKRFNLSVRSLPPESVIVNKPPPFYSLSHRDLWALVAIMGALVAFLAVGVALILRAKSAVERQKERADLLLTSTAEAIYGLDLKGICIFCNPAALELLGYRDELDLLGKELHTLIHHTRADGTHYPVEECRISEVLKKDISVHGEDEVLWRSDGTSFPVEFWSHPILKGKEKIGTLVTFLDISERKKAEEERELALRELNAFVYTVSHDLRSPLAGIIGFADFLLEQNSGHLNENARTALAEIRKQGGRMSAMMEDLLSLARVGRLPRPSAPVDTGRVVEEALREMDSRTESGGLSISVASIPEVKIPETFLIQIFSNLIGNAIRYAGPEGSPIEIGGERSNGRVRFFVRDHGPGIKESERDRIFEVFYRGAVGKEIAGTGIGLATVRKIARFYSGDAWVEETPGGGATFLVEVTDRDLSSTSGDVRS